MALGVVFAKLLVDAGMLSARPTLFFLDLVTVLPFVAIFAVAGSWRLRARARQALVGRLGFRDGHTAVAVGAVELILLSIGRDPFASTASTRSTDDGTSIIGAFTLLYLLVIVAVAAARLPRHSSTATGS